MENGRSTKTVYSKALENLDAHPLTPKRVGGSDDSTVAVYRLSGADDENEASRLLSHGSRASLEKVLGGRAVFAIPDRRQLLAAKADNVRAVAALRGLTTMYGQGPLRISGDLFEVEVDDQAKLRVARRAGVSGDARRLEDLRDATAGPWLVGLT